MSENIANTIENIIKIDMYKYQNDLMEYYIKEIQKELRDKKTNKSNTEEL